jgi:hypothetical protein
MGAVVLLARNGNSLESFFFLVTFAATIPVINSV